MCSLLILLRRVPTAADNIVSDTSDIALVETYDAGAVSKRGTAPREEN